MTTGYIPINRKLFEGRLWLEERQYSRFEAWLDLIQQARFEDGVHYIGYQELRVKRGQIAASYRFLSERWRWSTKKVSTYLDYLIKCKMIVKETLKETGSTLITLTNYEQYNPRFKTEETPKETPRKHQRNTKETNIINVNKDNNIISSLSLGREAEILDLVDSVDQVDFFAPPDIPPVAAPPPQRDDSEMVCDKPIDDPTVDCRVDVDLLNAQYKAKGQPRADMVIRVVPEKCRTTQEVWTWLDKFTDELKVKGEQVKTMIDFQSHFINWLKLQKNGKQQNSGAGGANHLQKYGDTSESEKSIMQDMQRLSGFSSKKIL